MKNTILRIITLVMAILFIVATTAVDSIPNTLYVVICIVTLGWWLLFMLANNDLTIEQLLGKWGRY